VTNMKEIDNFNQIKEILDFSSDDGYYFLELIKRRKDFPADADVKDHEVLYKYFISSKEKLEKIETEVKTLCDLLNLRAYINLNRKSKKKTTMLLMKECLSMIENDDYHKLKSRVDSAAGQCNGDKATRTFLIDVDTKNPTTLEIVISSIENVDPNVKHFILPTVNGYHIISTPFNVQEFNKLVKDENVTIKHNSPTLLYYKEK